MSADEGLLTEDDRTFLNTLETRMDDADGEDDYEEIVCDLRSTVRELEREFRQYQHRVDDRFGELERRIENLDADTVTDHAHPIERYADIPTDEREELLSTSEQLAVVLHEQWADIAWKLGGGKNYAGKRNGYRYGVDSKTKANAKYNPSQLKYRLQERTDRDLQSTQVYRALKRLAKLSGGDEYVEDGRVKIMGGVYSYEERPTPDNNETRRVLWRNE